MDKRRGVRLLAIILLLAAPAPAAPPTPAPNLATTIARPLRYHPEGEDFVIRNGGETFNRPLYGGHTAFRLDGGDKPEFVLYLPGRGGNLRFAVKTEAGMRWLHAMAATETRYRPGELLYRFSDPAFGAATLSLAVLAYHRTDGAIFKVAAHGFAPDAELIFAFGGASGVRGARDGDIGTEAVPISDYFRFRPEDAAGDRFGLTTEGFVLHGRTAEIAAVVPAGATLQIADGTKWNDAAALLAARDTDSREPVMVGRVKLAGAPLYLSLQRADRGAAAAADLPVYRAVRQTSETVRPLSLAPIYARHTLAQRFRVTERHFAHLRHRVRIDTPDPYLNAAMASLNVAADALWDGHAIMHGAIAWRTRLLGWRGAYVLDALGWHDRARENAAGWIGSQNTDAIPASLPPADADAHLARNEAGLHSNGDLSASHYDMNTVFIDAMLRHLAWSGDVAEARILWPVLERHLAWQKRLFRRPFGHLPLYEAYAQIWASDNIGYSGGGVTYASAYNIFANRRAAELASRIGENPQPYRDEADQISRAMRQYLWMDAIGAFAEYRDFLGRQMLHPSFGLWSFYHTIDSEVPTPDEAWRMTAALDRHLKRIPVVGKGVPTDRPYHVLPTSDWMPYQWSVNNVVMGENLHAALAYWQAGRREEAYRLAKGALLASLYMGISPGNIGTMNYLDVYRRESQRDFADGAGTMARAMVEGLFGVRPDGLNRRLEIRPGFPADWTQARLDHPDLSVRFGRHGSTDHWQITAKNAAFEHLMLRLPMAFARVDSISVNGRRARGTISTIAAGKFLTIAVAAKSATIQIRWAGPEAPTEPDTTRPSPSAIARFDWQRPVAQSVEAITLAPYFNDRVTAIFAPGKYCTPRSPYISLALPSQGIGGWAGGIDTLPAIDDSGLRAAGAVHLPNGVDFSTPHEGPNVAFTSNWDNYPRELRVPLSGKAADAFLLMAGSTNPMQSRIDNGEVIVRYADGTTARLALDNPGHWWPIEQDYFRDEYQFEDVVEPPLRVDLMTGVVRRPTANGGPVPGGAATVLHLRLDPSKELASLTVRTLANDVVIGLMALSLSRP